MQTAVVRGMLLGQFQLVNKKHILSIPNEQTCLELVYSNHFFHRCLTLPGKDLGHRKACQSLPNRSVTDSNRGTASALLDNIWQQLSKSLKALMVTDLSTRDKLQILAGGYSEHMWMQRGQTDWSTETFSLFLRLTSEFKSPTNTAQKQNGVG